VETAAQPLNNRQQQQADQKHLYESWARPKQVASTHDQDFSRDPFTASSTARTSS
jgi:hypothetical protein